MNMNFYGDIIVNIIGNNKLDNILAFLFYKGVDVKKKLQDISYSHNLI